MREIDECFIIFDKYQLKLYLFKHLNDNKLVSRNTQIL